MLMFIGKNGESMLSHKDASQNMLSKGIGEYPLGYSGRSLFIRYFKNIFN